MATPIETLRAAHHPVRRRIIDHLASGPAQVGTLARVFDQQVGSISHHLRMLERAGLVERAPELATDGRTSWWRIGDASLSWSVEDYDSPAERTEAKAAQRANLDFQLEKLSRWMRSRDKAPAEWRRASFSNDSSTTATAAELTELSERLQATFREWSKGIDRDDGQQREPVFVFAHGFPARP